MNKSKNTISREVSQMHKSTNCIIPFIWSSKQPRQSMPVEVRIVIILVGYWRSTRGASGMLVMFHFFIWTLVTQSILFVKIHQAVHLWPVHFFYMYVVPQLKVQKKFLAAQSNSRTEVKPGLLSDTGRLRRIDPELVLPYFFSLRNVLWFVSFSV